MSFLLHKANLSNQINLISNQLGNQQVITAHHGLMINDIFQKRRSNCLLCHQWCIKCRRNKESMDHSFLHCPLALVLWHRLFRFDGDWLVIPASCSQMLLIDYRGLRATRNANVLWICIGCTLFCVIWLERNATTFEDKFEDEESICDRGCYLFSVSILLPFKDTPRSGVCCVALLLLFSFEFSFWWTSCPPFLLYCSSFFLNKNLLCFRIKKNNKNVITGILSQTPRNDTYKWLSVSMYHVCMQGYDKYKSYQIAKVQ